MRLFFTKALLLVVALGISVPAAAVPIIADNFQEPGSQFSAGGNGIPATFEQANSFLVAANDFITGIDIAVSQSSPVGGPVNVHIRASAGLMPDLSSMFTSDISAMLSGARKRSLSRTG